MTAPPRLDLALIRIHPELSRRKAREVIEKGQVSLDGTTVREPGRRMEKGSALAWDPHRKALPRARLSLPLLHQDEHLLIVDKPAGLLAVPTAPGAAEDTALARVQEYVRHLRPRDPYVGVVHRIDRDTSGVLAFALTRDARQALRTLFREHRIERRYLALVQGQPRQEQGSVDLPIRDTYRAGRRGVARAGESARPALTHYRVLERFPGAALLEVELGTGRQHQVRAHLAHLGLPLLGDLAYRPPGLPPPPVPARRHMLHARRLALVHPVTGRRLSLDSEPPPDFARALAALRSLPGGRPVRLG